MLDFRELGEPAGESLERITRELVKRLGLAPGWSGRGADQGKDILFTEIQRGPISSRAVTWLVSCKDFSKSGRSVSEGDVTSVTDKTLQHGAAGFLLVCTTTASTGLKSMLDALDVSAGRKIFTRVWDAHELEVLLTREENHDIVKSYMPKSYKSLKELDPPHVDVAHLSSLLPVNISEQLQSLVGPYLQRVHD